MIMKSSAKLVATMASVALLAGCDIFTLDTHDPPDAMLMGRVVYNGEPVGVRSNGVQLELWQPGPEFELNTKIPVYVAQEGTYSANVHSGQYEINLLAGNGPWVSDPTRIPVTVSGETTLDIEVEPYYTIENVSYSYDPNVGTTGGITATFTVNQVNTSQPLELVGVYIGGNYFVDRNLGFAISNADRERSRAQVETELAGNQPITITVPLPDDVYETNSPALREEVFVRVGVKTAGVAEMLFTHVEKVGI